VLQFGPDNLFQNNRARRLEPGIEVNGPDDRFQRVYQQSGLAAASAFFFPPPQAKIFTQLKPLGDVN